MSQVVISADSPSDIDPEFIDKYEIRIINWRIMLEDQEFIDSVEIVPDDLYKAWYERKVLPRSTAPAPSDYAAHFAPFIGQGYEIVHISLGSGLSGAYQNACIAAAESGHVYPVDSQNLSTGAGFLAIRAAELARQGLTASEIQRELRGMCGQIQTSFLLHTLEFMRAGGRCSAVTLLGANLFQIKPCIEVENQNSGRMHVGEKYRGKTERCLGLYARDKLAGRDDIDLGRVFITHSGCPESDIQQMREEIARWQDFRECHVTRTGCVISTHCGPGTMGLLFITKK